MSPRAKLFYLGVASLGVQALVLATLYQASESLKDQAAYLAKIVSKVGVEHLDEFDLIALRDLGILKDAP